jgi:adenine-specific DNA-methyltransferase
MNLPLIKFQQLLRGLFQFNCADLDFGIYRIMNYKRDVIEQFITQDLPAIISKELECDALREQVELTDELEAIKKEVLAINDDAIDDSGNLVKYHDTKPGRRYLKIKEKMKSTCSREALEIAVYNHLYTFFNRYWQDGDFISKRRYSKQERYAIPYNGEEVMLYWANHDQYYIKTGEYFTDYTWKAPNGVTVYFKSVTADIRQDNVKGDKGFFLPRLDEITWDELNKDLTIPFEFRPLTEQEASHYGNRNLQEAIITEALKNISKHPSVKTTLLASAALNAKKHRADDGKIITYLEHHLHRYTRRNTCDFFIHKDLRGFLSRELDFYLKNELLNLDEIENAGEELAEGWFRMMRTIKRVGGHIIEFLSQIEEFQKKLWEKRKFITETFYCITVNRIPEEFYPEIAACDRQWGEWERLYYINDTKENLFNTNKNIKEQRLEFLRLHPALVLDTRYFPVGFTDRLLASFDNLDEITDGLLIHSENWQALNLLTEKYKRSIKCIYIDPPYNTGQSEILYKNSYKHSSWLMLMKDRLRLGHNLLAIDGMQCTTIDDVEFHRLRELIASVFGEQNLTGVAVIKNNPSGRSTVKGFSIAHEYGIFSSRSDEAMLGMLPRTKKQLMQYPEKDEIGRFQWRNFLRAGGANDFRKARPRLHYPLIVKDNKVRLPKMEWDNQKDRWDLLENPQEETVLWPSVNEIDYTWRLGVETLKTRLDDLRVRTLRNNRLVVEVKFRLDGRGVLAKTMWDEKEMNATAYGTTMLRNIIGESQVFSFPKSIYAVEKSLRVCSVHENQNVLDYFAGSGTTGHAVINLNREDGEKRKFILVEMAEYFDTVLLPRIKKIIFSPEWKDGKPERMATPEEVERSPCIIKIIRLESYEDALNNISFDESSGQQGIKFEDYLLKYMLHWETRKSKTLLNVGKLNKPFSYELRIHSNLPKDCSGSEIQECIVDLPETFVYLLGLSVEKRRVFNDKTRYYLVYQGIVREGRKAVVIWRETKGWIANDYRRDRDFINKHELTKGMDEIYVNGDSYIPGACALEGIFKERMFASFGIGIPLFTQQE